VVKKVRIPASTVREEDFLKEYEKLKGVSIRGLFDRISLCNTQAEVDAAVTVARLLCLDGINERNYALYFVLFETNNSFVIDNLIGSRDPFLLFSSITPNWFILRAVFALLSRFKRSDIYEKCLLSLLGVIQNAYKSSKYGFDLYPLSVSDVYNIGKYLDKKKDQLDRRNRLILDILLDIYNVGINNASRRVKHVALEANDVRMSFFDSRKNMNDVIPDVLLLEGDRLKKQIKPGITYQTRVKKS
jgi:hypothetical protein